MPGITRVRSSLDDGRTPPRLDVFDHQFGSARVAHERPLAGIVHGIRQVADQRDLKPELCHLPDSEAAIQDADVRMHAHQRDVRDAFLFEEVVDLLSVVADAVKPDDIDRRVLARPGIRRPVQSFTTGSSQPPVVSHRSGSCAPPRDRAGSEPRSGIEDAAFGSTLHAPAPGRSLVELHRVTGRVDDHHAEATGGVDYLIHARGHSGHTLRRHAAGMRVPHVANDDGRLSHFPAQRVLRGPDFPLPAACSPRLRARRLSAPGTRGRFGSGTSRPVS